MELVLIAVDGPVSTAIQRIYSAESHIPAHKIAINHNSSDYLRAMPTHGIIAEVSRGQARQYTTHELPKVLIDNLGEMGILRDRSEVKETRTIHIPNAYPRSNSSTPCNSSTCSGVVSREQYFFRARRFSEWSYINADEAHIKALSWEKLFAPTTTIGVRS